jgi:hypothetical protein
MLHDPNSVLPHIGDLIAFEDSMCYDMFDLGMKDKTFRIVRSMYWDDDPHVPAGTTAVVIEIGPVDGTVFVLLGNTVAVASVNSMDVVSRLRDCDGD